MSYSTLCVDRIQGYKATSKKNWSGTGLNAAGMSASNIWDNANADDLETLPNTIPHRDVEPAIINSDREEFIQAYLVVDGCPNDYISEKFVTAGVANNRSIQIPSLIQAALNRRKAGMIGEGENIRLNVQTQTSMTYIHNSKHVVAKALHDAVSSNHSPGHWS